MRSLSKGQGHLFVCSIGNSAFPMQSRLPIWSL